MRVTVKKSAIHGNGLFAVDEIPWGTKIIEYTGEHISDDVAEERMAEGADCIFELGNNENIDGSRGGNEARYANHRRDRPNCFVLREGGKIWIVAGIEGVCAGEEITFDYGSTFYPLRGRERAAVTPAQANGSSSRRPNHRPRSSSSGWLSRPAS